MLVRMKIQNNECLIDCDIEKETKKITFFFSRSIQGVFHIPQAKYNKNEKKERERKEKKKSF